MAMKKKASKKKASGKNWISGAIKKPGALRKSLGVKKGEKITHEMLQKAEKSKSPLTRKRASLAETLIKIARKK